MPADRNLDDEEVAKEQHEDSGSLGVKRRFKEFDCPDCSANNPVDDTFGQEDEVVCNYCGTEYRARVNDDGKLKLRPT